MELLMAIRQEIRFSAPPARIYEALLSSSKHSAFTGAPADIDTAPGGSWSAYGGAISGRNIDLVEGKRIVQAWRAGNWPEGKFSVVHMELNADEDGTRLVLEHTGYPEDQHPHLDAGWGERYWKPLATWLQS